MADEPVFKITNLALGKTLKRQHNIILNEYLMRAAARGCQENSVIGKVKGVAVPMKHEGVLG